MSDRSGASSKTSHRSGPGEWYKPPSQQRRMSRQDILEEEADALYGNTNPPPLPSRPPREAGGGKNNVAFADDERSRDGASNSGHSSTEAKSRDQTDRAGNTPAAAPEAAEVDGQEEPEPEAWDPFRESHDDDEALSCEGCYEISKRLLKVSFVAITFLMIFGCLVISKMSIVLITSNMVSTAPVTQFVTQLVSSNRTPCLSPGTGERDECGVPMCHRGNDPSQPLLGVRWMWAMCMCMGTPYVITVLRCFRQIMFKRKPKPMMGPTIMLDGTRAVLLMTGVGLLPSALRPLIKQHKALIVGDVFAIIVQLTAAIFYPVFTAVNPVDKPGTCNGNGTYMYTLFSGHLSETVAQFWPVPLAIVFVSLSYWENFIDKDNHMGEFGSRLWELKSHIHDTRTKTNAIAYTWKLALTFAMVFPMFLWKYPDADVSELFNSRNFYFELCPSPTPPADIPMENDWLLVYGVQAGVSLVGYYTATLTVMGSVQVATYTLAVTLATPATIGFLQWACLGCNRLWAFDMFAFFNCFNGWTDWVDLASSRWTYIGFFWWFSQLWITRHLWRPTIERLARTDRIMVIPGYCGALLEQSLSYNRRRNDAEADKLELKSLPFGKKVKKRYDNKSVKIPKSDSKPKIYLCATMWHETEAEMTQILKSVFRLDQDQWSRRMAQEFFEVTDPDFYEFECHVFFDDAYKAHGLDETEYSVNDFVRQLVKTVQKAAFSAHKKTIKINDPIRIPTPYGGRLEFSFPGGNKFIVHMKDKIKIRHRKRWSQVMYMYYFLGHELWAKHDSTSRRAVLARNTFLLALDGDVDFKPEAVILLIDLMKRNQKVGAACGRIHPIGSGPMVWYQKFEYSIGHWLQKSTEHVLGCVLCSPGCFSLFRGSALMDDNVMKTYTKTPVDARHHVQYDQGEDRWLCTLLLQQGYRVEYSAASDALTYAPESFEEFFNQRRRWSPSTMSNILDLLETGGKTVQNNENISRLYIVYQGTLFITSILGPGTIFMLLVGALESTFLVGLGWLAFLLIFVPILAFFVAALTLKTQTQLKFAFILSVITIILQMVVTVGLAVMITEDGLCNPASWILVWVLGVFTLAAILHPQEGLNILYFPVYYVAVPAMYLILIIYSMCNMNNISWGTREVPKTAAEKAKEAEIMKESKEKAGITSEIVEQSKSCCPCFNKPSSTNTDASQAMDGLRRQMEVISEDLQRVQRMQLAQTAGTNPDLNRNSVVQRAFDSIASRLKKTHSPIPENFAVDSPRRRRPISGANEPEADYETTDPPKREQLVNPAWLEDKALGTGPTGKLSEGELNFWNDMIEKYLKPLEYDSQHKEKMEAGLKELRDKAVLAFFMFNIVFIVLVSALQAANLSVHYNCTRPATAEVVSVDVGAITIAFTIIFGLVMLLQVTGMLFHRVFTLLQVISSTSITKRNQETGEDIEGNIADGNMTAADAVELVKKMHQDFDVDTESMASTAVDSLDSDKPAENIAKRLKKPAKIHHVETMDKQFARKFLALHELAKTEPVEEYSNVPPSRVSRFRSNLRSRRYTRTERAMNDITRRPTVVKSDDHARRIKEKYDISDRQVERVQHSAQMRRFTKRYAPRSPMYSAHEPHIPEEDYENVQPRSNGNRY